MRLAEGVTWVSGKIWILDEAGLTLSVEILLAATHSK